MKLNRRIELLEHKFGDSDTCPACKGNGGPLYRAEFLSGEPPVEGGQCRRCHGVGSKQMCAKQYLFPDRATFDAV